MAQPQESHSSGLLNRSRLSLELAHEVAPIEADSQGAGPPTAPSGGWDRLSFTRKQQEQLYWCWAAVASAVSQFYDALSKWTQCAIVDAEFKRGDCCIIGADVRCNREGFLDRALSHTGNLDRWIGNLDAFSTLRDEIRAGRPLGARIGWAGGCGHFVAVAGCLEGSTRYIAVEDPWFGTSDVSYNAFRTTYLNAGRLTHIYFTRR